MASSASDRPRSATIDGARSVPLDEVREAMVLPAATPVLVCDVRRRESATAMLVAVVKHAPTLVP